MDSLQQFKSQKAEFFKEEAKGHSKSNRFYNRTKAECVEIGYREALKDVLIWLRPRDFSIANDFAEAIDKTVNFDASTYPKW